MTETFLNYFIGGACRGLECVTKRNCWHLVADWQSMINFNIAYFDWCCGIFFFHFIFCGKFFTVITSTVRATTRSRYMMPSPTFAKWRPCRETRGKVTSWLFAAPRCVLSPYYFESCDFRQWEIRGVKKIRRPMNVVRSWEVKRSNTRVFQLKEMLDKEQKIEKKKVSVIFWTVEKNFFEIYIKFACW